MLKSYQAALIFVKLNNLVSKVLVQEPSSAPTASDKFEEINDRFPPTISFSGLNDADTIHRNG